MTRRTGYSALILAAILFPSTSQANRATGRELVSEGKAEEAPPRNAWQRWTRFIDRELDEVGKADLYGVTAQLPKGYASVKWDFTTLKASKRYNDKHQLTPLMPAIGVGGGQRLDLGLRGHGGGHTFQASYGITDAFDWYFELPYQFMHLGFHPRLLDERGEPVQGTLPDGSPDPDYAWKAGIRKAHELLPLLGRPVPAMQYDAEWVLGDINTGFSWNLWRTKRMSAAFTGRIFFPTGRVANPNSSLMLGTGPELDTGMGGWGLGFTQGYDLRIYKYSYWIDIIASSEFTLSYGFKHKRRYPTNFTTEPNRTVLQTLANGEDGKRGTRDDDYSVYNSFPDLRHLKDLGSYSYTPGFGLQWLSQLQIQLAVLGISFGYGVIHSQEPEIDGDYYFIQMAKGLQLLGQQTVHAIQVGGALSLLPVYIPLDISFSWRKIVDGYNAIVMDNYWNIIVKTYIPIFR